MRFKIDGSYDISFDDVISICGSSFGIHTAYAEGFDDDSEIGVGGVMDYEEVAKLHQFLGSWLRKFEDENRTKDRTKFLNNPIEYFKNLANSN